MENLKWLIIVILLIVVFFLCRKIIAQKKKINALEEESKMSGTIYQDY